MASNPYGITQVDVPGLLGAYESQKRAGVQDMLMRRQIEQQDEELGIRRQERKRAADVDALFTGDALPEPGAVFKAGGAKAGFDYAQHFSTMKKAEREAAAARVDALARVGVSLKKLPYAQRRAALEAAAPTLAEMGFTPEQVRGYDPTDEMLDATIAQSMEVKDQLDLAHKDRTFGLDVARFDETRRHNMTSEETARYNALKPSASEGGRPPAGYRVAADGVSLEFIPGGPADPKNRRKETTLPAAVVEKLGKEAETVQQIMDLSSGFDDDFSGVGTRVGNLMGRLGAGTEGQRDQANWWQRMEAFDNVVRNQLFGASLTAGEQAAWERTTVTPTMSAKTIRDNLAERQRILDRSLQRKASAFKIGGYPAEAIDALVTVAPPAVDFSKTSLPRGAAKPVAVKSVGDVQKLTPGTPFVIPSGPNKGKIGYAK